MKKYLRRLFFKIFKRYERLELKCFSWYEADVLLRKNEGKSEDQQWSLAPEEDHNRMIGFVFLERRRRIKE